MGNEDEQKRNVGEEKIRKCVKKFDERHCHHNAFLAPTTVMTLSGLVGEICLSKQ